MTYEFEEFPKIPRLYHTASRQMYKRTFAQDGGKWKGG